MHPIMRAVVLVTFLLVTIPGGGLLMLAFISYVAPNLAFLPYFLHAIVGFTGMLLSLFAGMLLGVPIWMLLMKPFVSREEMNSVLREPLRNPEFEYPVVTPLIAKVINVSFELIY
jgi:hypothetical protein